MHLIFFLYRTNSFLYHVNLIRVYHHGVIFKIQIVQNNSTENKTNNKTHSNKTAYNNNKSIIVTGIFPDKLKIAKVIPLYNKDDPSILGNYRPISLLPAISKLFERVLFNQIHEFFTMVTLHRPIK